MISIFLSHSSEDRLLAERLVDLLRTALNLRADTIRCTSVDGYRLPAGADSDEQLRREVLDATVFVGLLSSISLNSAYVLIELGARWGAGKPLVPLLAPGLTAHALRGPIAGLNALSCESPSQLHQLVRDLGRILDIHVDDPHAYQAKIDALVYRGAEQPDDAQPADPGPREALLPTSRGEKAAGDDYADSDVIIKHHCEKEWPDDFSMRAYCIQQQRDAVATLRRTGPDDIPVAVLAAIRRKCAAEWPDDYAMRVYCEEQQVAGYREVNGD